MRREPSLTVSTALAQPFGKLLHRCRGAAKSPRAATLIGCGPSPRLPTLSKPVSPRAPLFTGLMLKPDDLAGFPVSGTLDRLMATTVEVDGLAAVGADEQPGQGAAGSNQIMSYPLSQARSPGSVT